MMVFIPCNACTLLVLKMKNRPVVVWDWNGTLVDDAFVFVDIMNFFLQQYSLKKISLKDYRQHFCFPVKKYYSFLGFNLTNKQFESLSDCFIKKYKKNMFKPLLKEGVVEVLKKLSSKNFSQVIVSAQEQSLLNASVEHYGLHCYFEGVYGLKNNFAISKAALVKQKIQPFVKEGRPVLFVGDTVHDVEVSRLVGAGCCLVSWGHNSSANLLKKKVFVASSPSCLFNYINTFFKA